MEQKKNKLNRRYYIDLFLKPLLYSFMLYVFNTAVYFQDRIVEYSEMGVLYSILNVTIFIIFVALIIFIIRTGFHLIYRKVAPILYASEYEKYCDTDE